MRTTLPLATIATIVAFAHFADPAHAARARVFVASYGSDSNPCTFGSPCKTFQQAVNVVAVGGEVAAIDSAGFGTITISHAITITSPAGVEAGIAALASGAAAITITAGASDIINLSGLTLDGAGVTNTTGIQFNSGGQLSIRGSAIRNFTADGIDFLPNSSALTRLYVSNTLVADNGGLGLLIQPAGSGTTNGVLDHVHIEDNGSNILSDGLAVQTSTQTINITISDSVSANNSFSGIAAISIGGTPVNVMVRNSTITNNRGDGLEASGSGANVRVTRSTVTGNASGWEIFSGGAVSSFGDNDIFGNGSANNAPAGISHE